MGITELVRNAKYEKGFREGRIEGMQIAISVIDLIIEGKSVDFICEKMDVSEEIVNRHISKISGNK